MKVMVLYTQLPEALSDDRTAEEFDLRSAAEGAASALPLAVVEGVRGAPEEILKALDVHRPDVVFNLCEAPLGRPDREAHAAALLEWRGIRFTGSGSETLTLCRRKDLTKAVLDVAGIPVPRRGSFPCIVKPADEDGSAGIDADSICADAQALERALARLPGPAIVEEYLPGTEFVVSLWGGNGPDHVMIGEVHFDEGPRIFTYDGKWRFDSPDFENSWLEYPMDLDPALRGTLIETARKTWRAVGARGYLRLDIRLDGQGVARVLDVNPNPEVTPGRGGMNRAVTEAGWTWEQFIRRQVEWALGGPI